jgi:hypothetical protein
MKMLYLFALFALTAAGDPEKTIGDISVKFQGSSGGMTITHNPSGSKIKIAQDKVQEIGTGGGLLQFNVAGGTATWSDIKQDGKVYTTTFTTSSTRNEGGSSVTCNLKLDVRFADESADSQVPVACANCTSGSGGCKTTAGVCSAVNNAGACDSGDLCTETVKVHKGSLEFSVLMDGDGYTFKDAANTLEYGVIVTPGKGAKPEDKGEKTEDGGAKKFSLSLGDDGFVDSAQTVKIGGVSKSMNAPKVAEKGGKQIITWSFPQFNGAGGEQLVYDPTVGVNTSSGSWLLPSITLLALMFTL